MDLSPPSTALIAVHMQGDIAGPDGAFSSFFHEQVTARGTVTQVGRVIEAARAAGALVVFTKVAWQPDYSDLHANSPLLQIAQQSGALKEGEARTEILAELARQPSDLVHTHRRIGGFDADLDRELRQRGITTVLICGVATNASVEGTARQLGDAGYNVVIIEDACSAGSPEAHAASVASMGLIGEITNVAAVVEAFAATPVSTP